MSIPTLPQRGAGNQDLSEEPMASDPGSPDPKPRSWFTRPLAGRKCALGWIIASALFLGVVSLAGGPAVGDAGETIYPTWAVSHAEVSCLYPPHPHTEIPGFAAPVYPLVAGAIGAVFQFGDSAHFPSTAAMGHNCDRAITAMVHWSEKGSAVWPTIYTGYVGWAALLIGLILYLRASRRGRTGWEPTTLAIVAVLPPVWLCIEMYAHPQDLLAMGLALAAAACALKDRWLAAGILVALSALAQPFGILVAIPLLVLAPPGRRRLQYIGSAVVAVAVISLPLIALGTGAITRDIFIGSGNAVVGGGSTVLWEIHLRGSVAVLLSRVLPLIVCFAIASYAVRRCGRAAVLQAPLLMALLAVSLGTRLVFEDNLFAYYFMALAVSLIVVDALEGRIRETVVGWIAMVTLVYSEYSIIVWRQSWGEQARRFLPAIVMVVGLLLIIRAVLNHRVGWNVAVWAAAVASSLLVWPISSDPFTGKLTSLWMWQVILVGIGMALAVGPLARLIRQSSKQSASVIGESEEVEPTVAIPS